MRKILAVLGAISTILTPAFVGNKANACDYENVVFVGNEGSDKTQIIRRIYNNHTNFSSIRGLVSDFTEVRMNDYNSGCPHEIRMIDTAGSSNYRSLVPLYVRGAKVAVIVCNYNDLNSFNSVTDWVDLIRNCNGDCRIIIVANHAEIEQSQRTFNISNNYDVEGVDNILEVSSQTGLGIKELEGIIMCQCDLYDENMGYLGKVDISDTSNNQVTGKSGCCI